LTSITWPVVTRTHVIDRLVTDAVRDGADAVLNLAAGLDTKSARIPL
jgi:O-methyltransferase involved in polyketide biosynthesis